MGILPLCFQDGESAASLGLKGDETYDIRGIRADMKPRSVLDVQATAPDGRSVDFKAMAMLHTEADVNYYRNGGILQTVLRNLLR